MSEQSAAAELRARLGRERLMGTFVKLPALEAIDICKLVGFDFAIVDLQHSQISEGSALQLVRHGWALRFPVVVRIPTPDAGLVNRLLEAGACGLQLAEVRRAAEVRSLVEATRFPPSGRRSVSLSHPVAGYGTRGLREAVEVEPPILIGQLETAKTTDPLPELLRGGLDVAFLGMADLKVDLAFDEARVATRVAEIEREASAAGVRLGAYASDPDAIPEGADYVALSSDVSLLAASLREALLKAR